MADKNRKSQQKPDYAAIREQAETDFKSEFGTDELLQTNEAPDSLEQEVGMEEVYLDPAALDRIAVDDTDDDLDANAEEQISNLPQEMTESYGTGLQGKPSDRAGRFSRWSENHLENQADPILTGGDIDANYEQASVVGDEAVGGTVATPDQDIVEELAAAVGVELDDYTDLRVNDMLEERDDRRWELDPKSSEDYPDRGA